MERFNFGTMKTENIDIYDLRHCDRKSFYGKAKIIETAEAFYLLSYKTIVCKVDKATRSFTKFWSGESATTMRHINAFLLDMGLTGGGVKWWRDQEWHGKDSFAMDFSQYDAAKYGKDGTYYNY